MEIKFDKDPLVVEQNNYTTKTVNAYVIHELDTWPKILLYNFKLTNCLFRVRNIVKISDKAIWVYSGCDIAFDEGGSWSYGNDFAKSVWRYNSSSSHSDNQKNIILVLGEDPTYDINGSSTSSKKVSINSNSYSF